jgi:predicted amidohydrolase
MDTASLAEKMDGKSMQWMKASAKQFQCSIAGSLIIEQNGEVFNRLVWMYPEGEYQVYDKRHLFRMGKEEEYYTRGNSLLHIKQESFRIRPLVCYDLRFPVWSRNRGDYDVLIYIANWPASRQDVWNSLLKARAIENQSYVIGVNRVGIDGMGIKYEGGSIMLDARGQVVASLSGHSAGTLQASLSLEALNSFREKFPVWKDSDSFTIDN